MRSDDEMLWKTHIRITTEVMNRLRIRLTVEELSILKEGAVAPDKWKDYPHHYGKSQEICKYLNKARSFFLTDDSRNAYLHLAIALHYIQDSYTTYPSFLPKHHEWEQWIEESHFVSDIEGAIQSASMNRSMRDWSFYLAQELSREVQGRNNTLRIATLNEQEKKKDAIASPKVDLNLGLLASYLISKSVLGPKRSPSLDAELIDNFNKYEGFLNSAETEACKEIIKLVDERNDHAKRVTPPNGILTKLMNWLTNRKIRSLDKIVLRMMDCYFSKEHLAKIADQYYHAAFGIVQDHYEWYIYHIPTIDINIITSRLIDLQAASMAIGLERGTLKKRLLDRNVPLYLVGGCELVERDSIDGLDA